MWPCSGCIAGVKQMQFSFVFCLLKATLNVSRTLLWNLCYVSRNMTLKLFPGFRLDSWRAAKMLAAYGVGDPSNVVIAWFKPGVSNLFDWRAKCTNFKLVGGPDIEMHRGGREWGGGVPLPSQLGCLGECHKLLQCGPGAEPRQKTSFGVF